MSSIKQANAIIEIPAQPTPTGPPLGPPSSPPPQPRTWSRAVQRRRPKAPLLPRRYVTPT
ncbi:hypothetical protein DB30_00047 [Enhygromyxa salina]|uniref:Uncharacterized protein n=1 Tax=Enhygromyxa salina TaxID=215803 RepID=A0A0C2A7J8_9BACT|nr:hypothetical protein DB30_00047 [Enhygromyxa salina]